jgi:hypothetical protein
LGRFREHTRPEDIGETPEELFFTRTKFILAVTFAHVAIKLASVGESPRTPTEAKIKALVGGRNVDDPSERAPILFGGEGA